MKNLPNYTNLYYNYIHESFNIDNEIYDLKKLNNINFIKNCCEVQK
jgi:hypothetical protein